MASHCIRSSIVNPLNFKSLGLKSSFSQSASSHTIANMGFHWIAVNGKYILTNSDWWCPHYKNLNNENVKLETSNI